MEPTLRPTSRQAQDGEEVSRSNSRPTALPSFGLCLSVLAIVSAGGCQGGSSPQPPPPPTGGIVQMVETTGKSSGTMNGGNINPAYYPSLGQYFVLFVQNYQKQGIQIYAVSPQNEPLNS